MKSTANSFRALAAPAAFILLVIACACTKESNDNDEGKMWDPSWLVGTWEGTTPSSVTPFENTKIRIIIDSYDMIEYDTLPSGVRKAYGYTGVFYWAVDDPGTWSMAFTQENYPIPDHNIILWDCLKPIGDYTMNNVSMRIGDTLQTDPWHSMDLDWGPFADNSGNPPTHLDWYGDIEIDFNGTYYRAEYPPDEATMIRLTKK